MSAVVILDMHTQEAVRDLDHPTAYTRHLVATEERPITIEGSFALVGDRAIPLSNIREFTIRQAEAEKKRKK